MQNVQELADNKTSILRLKHNGNEPIYVHIDDSINDKTESLILQSLNYIENIFSLINDKYTFKVIDEQKAEKIKDIRTVITYKAEDLPPIYNGANTRLFKNYAINDYEFYIHKSTIKLRTSFINDFIDSEPEKILYALNHELLHAFGLSDVYIYDKDETTFMKVDLGEYYEIISPNDFKLLYTLRNLFILT